MRMVAAPLLNFAILTLALAPAVVSPAQTAATDDPVTAAQAAETTWLKFVDTAQYEATWTSAAASLRAALPEPQWEQALRSARAPLGTLQTRKLKQATFTHTLPGAPDGDYVIVQYTSAFEHKAAALETVTATHEPDGTWRVAGYFIR